MVKIGEWIPDVYIPWESHFLDAGTVSEYILPGDMIGGYGDVLWGIVRVSDNCFSVDDRTLFLTDLMNLEIEEKIRMNCKIG